MEMKRGGEEQGVRREREEEIRERKMGRKGKGERMR